MQVIKIHYFYLTIPRRIIMDEERRYLEALARDDRSAFDALYLKYAAKTEEFLYRMLKDHSEAEDITQDIFLKIWRNRTSIGAVDAFGPYLFRMARNAVYDRFDNRSVRENYARRASLLPEYELPDSAIDSRDLLLLIRMVVENAHAEGIWAGICGELGADTTLTEEFLKMGVDELSVSAGKVLAVRKVIRETRVS